MQLGPRADRGLGHGRAYKGRAAFCAVVVDGASGVPVGVQLGPRADDGLGHGRVHKAGAVAVLLEVGLRI